MKVFLTAFAGIFLLALYWLVAGGALAALALYHPIVATVGFFVAAAIGFAGMAVLVKRLADI